MRFLALAGLLGLASGLNNKQKLQNHIARKTAHLPDTLKNLVRSGLQPLLDARSDAAWQAGSALTSTDSQWCPNSSYWEFVPAMTATVSQAVPDAAWAGDGCFTSMKASVSFNSTGASVTLSGSGATSLLCSDTYLIATSYSIQVADVGALGPTATVGFAQWLPNEQQDVALNGLNIYVLPCGLLGTIDSVTKTVALFDSTNYTAMASSNLDFLTERNIWPSPLQPFGQHTAIDVNSIKSGDYLAISRLDGLDPMIMFGTGGVTGHSAVAVWQTVGSNRTLYVVESTDADPAGPVYWPPPYGIIRHEWHTWVALAQTANFTVSVLPLAPQYASVFNETAFWNWFATVQGMPYGYHTMLYSFLDTGAPLQNMPLPFTGPLLATVMNLVEQAGLLPNATAGVSVYSMLTMGLNKRLGTNCGSLACILATVNANKAAGTGPASFTEAVALPDNDAWIFDGNYSMVCSEMAAHSWRAGLGGAIPLFATQFIANEQTPKDNYQMAIYDAARFTATNCPGGLIASPSGNGNYCQIMGPYVQELNGYNSYAPYPNMNNGCASQWPTYGRCPNGEATCQC